MQADQGARPAAAAAAAAGQRGRGSLPGAWRAAVIAGASALAFGYWSQAAGPLPGPPIPADASRLADVAAGELPEALDTVVVSPAQRAAFGRGKPCAARLAWVSVVRAPGQPAGRIRLQSGRYVSPQFALGDTPVRVALPYPAPFAAGRGTISVLGTTVDAIVSLTPPWPVAAKGGPQARPVTWTPVGACPAA